MVFDKLKDNENITFSSEQQLIDFIIFFWNDKWKGKKRKLKM